MSACSKWYVDEEQTWSSTIIGLFVISLSEETDQVVSAITSPVESVSGKKGKLVVTSVHHFLFIYH